MTLARSDRPDIPRAVPRFLAFAIVLGAAMALAAPVHAQGGLLGRVKREAQRTAEDRAARKTRDATNNVLDAMECAAGDRRCEEEAKRQGRPVKIVEAPAAGGGEAGAGNATKAGPPRVGEGEFVNFDFQPGETPLFVEDFTKEQIGNFPRRLTFREGSMEVVEWEGRRLLKVLDRSRFEITLPGGIPERYTIEIEVKPQTTVSETSELWLSLGANQGYGFWGPMHAKGLTMVGLEREMSTRRPRMRVEGGGVKAGGATRSGGTFGSELVTWRIMVDGSYIKGYVNGERLVNVPNASFPRKGETISLAVYGRAIDPAYIGSIRIMKGGRKLYDALAESGRVATQGIFFDTGSDVIRPESKPTLDEIGGMLTEHPDLRLLIEGHTDNVGQASANQQLSERRAAAVRERLVRDYGIDGGRLGAKGLGASKPAAPNTTAEGRQQNRRVELVRQ